MVRGPVARAVSAFRFADPFSALHEALDAAALAAEEWVVVLSHLGRETDVALLERFPRVDLVLGGHSHEAYAHVESGRASCAPAPYGGSVALVHAEGPLGAASVSVELVPSDGGRVR
jgi:2',3'-cyclic-nucleotide 2'-phosphodiesterase (5'-nucleotidase family)